MQFSVIVEGSVDGAISTEDSSNELERFLLSAKISPEFLKQINSGKPLLIKNKLTYEEAVKICDRLMDFGVDSFIDPPTKPEAAAPKPAAPEKPAANVAQLRSKSSQANSAGAKPAPKKSAAPTAQQKNNVRALHQSPRKAGSATTSGQQTVANQGDLHNAANQVKALFKLPKGGLNPISIDTSAIVKTRLHAGLSVLLLALYPLAVAMIAMLTVYFTVSAFFAMASLSVILAAIFALVPLVLGGYTTLVLSVPLWFMSPGKKKHTGVEPQVVTAKEQPQLFMLTSAICKLVNVPAPKSIELSIPASKHLANSLWVKPTFTLKEFFNIKKPLETHLTLNMSVNLVNTLLVRQYCGLVARESSRYASPKTRRASVLQYFALQHAEVGKIQAHRLTEALAALNLPAPLAKLQDAIDHLTSITGRLESLAFSYFSFCENTIRHQLESIDSPFSGYHSVIIGDESIGVTYQQLADVNQAYYDAITTLFDENEGQVLVDNLPQLTLHMMPKVNPRAAETKRSPIESIIVGQTLARDLITQVDQHCKTLTDRVYKKLGSDTAQQNYVSVKAYFSQKDKQKRLAAIGHEYFGKWYHPHLLWRVPSLSTLNNSNTEALIKKLNRCIERIRYQTPDRSSAIEKFNRIAPQIAEFSAARKLAMSGVDSRPHGISSAGKTLEDNLKKLHGEFKELNTELGQHGALFGERLALGLLLDIEHQPACQKIYTALAALSECSSKFLQLRLDCHELEILIAHKPKKSTQHYTLQTKELQDRIDDSCKQILRKLRHCPFDMCDTRFPTLADMVDGKLGNIGEIANQQRTLARGFKIADIVSEGHETLSHLAAGYATRVEKIYGVESIRRAKSIDITASKNAKSL